MDDLIRKSVYVNSENVTLELSYRMNFDAEKSCGSLKIFSGSPSEDEENYEIYMELLDCGMSVEELDSVIAKTLDQIKSGKLDVKL
ncbi:MAG: hypothetical protein ACP5NK_05185 [Thermoplasmata archaeon]